MRDSKQVSIQNYNRTKNRKVSLEWSPIGKQKVV